MARGTNEVQRRVGWEWVAAWLYPARLLVERAVVFEEKEKTREGQSGGVFLFCVCPSHTPSTTSTQLALPPHLYVKRSGAYVASAANLESWPPYVGPPLWAHRLQRFYDIVTSDMTSAERAGLADQFMRSTAGKRSWTLDWWGRPLELTFKACDFNFIFAMRLWSLSGVDGAPFFPGVGIPGGFLSSPVPIAAWLNPHLTTGYAVEISKFFNIQSFGMQDMLTRMVASGLTMEEARAVQGHN
jgi:hypothetical protein